VRTMNRDEFTELVYETFADEPDNVLANGIIEAADAYVEHEKAKLFSEGTTKDAISRQQAIDAAKDWYEGLICGSVNGLIKRLNALPTAQPEPHEGHWIKHIDPFDGEQYECSECGVLWEFNDGTPEDNEAYFCPNCGAKMKGGSNERTD